MQLTSVVPSPVWADDVIEGLVLPRSSHDGMFGCLVVAKLYVWWCHAAMAETGLAHDCCPCFQKINMKALEPVNCCNSAVALVGRGHSWVVRVKTMAPVEICWHVGGPLP